MCALKLNEIEIHNKNTFLTKFQLTSFLTDISPHVYSAFVVCYYFLVPLALLSDMFICFPQSHCLYPHSLPCLPSLVIFSFPTDMGIIGSQGCPYSIIKV